VKHTVWICSAKTFDIAAPDETYGLVLFGETHHHRQFFLKTS